MIKRRFLHSNQAYIINFSASKCLKTIVADNTPQIYSILSCKDKSLKMINNPF